MRQGLAKQDRLNHYGTFVPAFSENKLVDPKRSLYFCVKKPLKNTCKISRQITTNYF